MKRWVLALLAVCSTSCARGPNVGSELPLQRVVIYRNGVGYFERAGSVDSTEVTFDMRQRMVGDFLASLAVMERGGSSVRSASFPLEVEDLQAPEPDEPQLLVKGVPRPPRLLKPNPNAMRKVVLHLDGKEHDLLIGYLSETPVWRPSYRVVIAEDGSASLQAWGIVQNLSGEDWKDVSLSLVAGAPLAFQSTLGTPVVPVRPIVTDEGEVMQVVPTAVTSLDRTPGGKEVDRYGPDEAPPQPAPAPAVEAADADMSANEDGVEREEAASSQRTRKRGGVAGAGVGAATATASGRAMNQASPAARPQSVSPASPPPPRMTLSEPRRLSDLAAVAQEGGTTRYDMPFKVTVPNETATMVLLTSQRVPGQAVLLFAPEPGATGSEMHPFRVVRITNTTPGLLERGPIAVFEQASFLGQGLLDPLPSRATATVPFALERSVALSRDQKSEERGGRLYRIETSRLFVERDWVLRTLYRIDNGGAKPANLLVKHARSPGTRLFKPPANTEDNEGSGVALVPVALRARSKTELTVDERRANPQEVDWLSPVADEAVKQYLADRRARPEVVAQLGAAWTVREALRKARDELEKLENERNELERSSDETRRNLRAIEKNPQAQDLRLRLTKRLADASTRLDAITKRSIELRMSADELQIRFRDAIRDIKLDAPLPPLE